jgi:hypothetical protein
MEEPRDEIARDLMRLGDVDGASKIAETEIQRAGDQGNSIELWRLRFIRAEVLEAHGRADEALKYIESLTPPPAQEVESCASLKMHRGFYSGLLGRYELAHRLLGEAEVTAHDGGLPSSKRMSICLGLSSFFARRIMSLRAACFDLS